MSDACPYTPLTRLHVVIGEARGYAETLMQRILCSLYREASIDAVALVYTPPPDELLDYLMAARRLSRGGLLTSYTLGVIAIRFCEEMSKDVARIGYVDTFVVKDDAISCHALLPEAIAECIPRGVDALLAVRYRWEAKLLLAALAKRGYQRAYVTSNHTDPERLLMGLDRLFGLALEPIPYQAARHYARVVDVTIDAGVLEGVETEKRIVFHLDAPTSSMPCIMGRWAAKAILLLEDVFIEPAEAEKIAESLVDS